MTSPANLFGDEPNPAEDRMADTPDSPRGTCRRCGRALRVKRSVDAGIGPECARLEGDPPDQPAPAAGELDL